MYLATAEMAIFREKVPKRLQGRFLYLATAEMAIFREKVGKGCKVASNFLLNSKIFKGKVTKR